MGNQKKVYVFFIVVLWMIFFYANGCVVQAEAYSYGDYTYEIINNNTEIKILGYQGTMSELVIPSQIEGKNVTCLGDMAFAENTYLTNVTIPATVNTVGEWVFGDCFKLKEVNILNDIENIGIGMFAFCYELEDVTLPNNMSNIGESMFLFCESLEQIDIPNTVTVIGKEAFSWCYNLKKIAIPQGVTTINDGTFSACDSLTKKSVGKNALCETNPRLVIKVPKSKVKAYRTYFQNKGNTSVTIKK